MPSFDLAAMKAYAWGRRAKWKDYVDLYFIIQYHYSITELSARGVEIYQDLFSEKQFRAQLSFFEDVDYSEEVEFLTTPVPVAEIKEKLVQASTKF